MINNHQPEGLFIDLVDYFSEKLNWHVIYIEGTWGEMLDKLEKGEIDLLPAVGYTKDRSSIFDFSKNPVFIDSGVLFTNPGFTLHTVFDLRGKRIAALKDSIFTKGFIDYTSSFDVSCDMILTQNNQEVMELISSGLADAGVCIYSLGNELARKYPVMITQISFTPTALLFAVPRGINPDLIKGIDELMAPMMNDQNSFYSRTFDKWTFRSAPYKLPTWLLWAFAALFVLGLFLGSYNFMLRRQIHLKTRHLESEITQHKLAEEKIKRNLSEKDTLIRELFHRTKNTLQVINGLISLQAEEYPDNIDVARLVKNTGERIQAISLVHQMLYRTRDLSRISIKEYIGELSSLIFQNYGISDNRIRLNANIQDQSFLIDIAIPIGLVLNELITNSIRHGFPDDSQGVISITLAEEKTNKYMLQYSDNGIGVPEGFDFRNQPTLGMNLVCSLVEEQLSGKVFFKGSGGMSCLVEISADIYEERV